MTRMLICMVAMGCTAPDVGDLNLSDAERCSDSDPSTTVSFARDIRPLTARAPGGCNCHRTGTVSGLNIGSYDNLREGGDVSGTSLIVPGKPCESLLVGKLSPTPPFGSRMPFNGPPYWTIQERQLVVDWISEGARNN